MTEIQPRRRVEITVISYIHEQIHCSLCCHVVSHQNSHLKSLSVVDALQTMEMICDCSLEKIPLYVEYERGPKEHAYECLSCGAINKLS